MPGTVTRVEYLHEPPSCYLVTIQYDSEWEREHFGPVEHKLHLCQKHQRVLYARAQDMARTTGEEANEIQEQLHQEWAERYAREQLTRDAKRRQKTEDGDG